MCFLELVHKRMTTGPLKVRPIALFIRRWSLRSTTGLRGPLLPFFGMESCCQSPAPRLDMPRAEWPLLSGREAAKFHRALNRCLNIDTES